MPENFIAITERVNLQKIGSTFVLSANGGTRHWPEYVNNSMHFDAAIAVALRDAITSMLTPEEAADPQAANEPEPPELAIHEPAPASSEWVCMVKSVGVTECPKGNSQCDADRFCMEIPF